MVPIVVSAQSVEPMAADITPFVAFARRLPLVQYCCGASCVFPFLIHRATLLPVAAGACWVVYYFAAAHDVLVHRRQRLLFRVADSWRQGTPPC